MKRQKITQWTPFEPAVVPMERKQITAAGVPDAVWRNSKYTVWVYEKGNTPLGPLTHLSIKRNDKEVIHDWRDLQRIKNEICGREREAFEVYPAESRLVDTANQYHLFVLPEDALIPIGFFEGRVVMEKETMNAKQRPWDDDSRPADLMEPPKSLDDLNEFSKEATRRREEYLKQLEDREKPK
jgi:hypothetical protein